MTLKGFIFRSAFLLCFMFFSMAEALEIRYDGAGRRDPFVPLIGPYAVQSEVPGDKDYEVEGIVFDDRKDSYAVISSDIYREGDTIAGAKLIKIFKDRVVLLQKNEEIVIWLREEMLMEPSADR